jgi:TRAP-type C4-dicarboxylate transport system permease small subunit
MSTGAAAAAPASTAARRLARLADLALLLAGLMLVALAAVQGWQVFARYVMNESPSWTEPVAILLMNGATMLGAAAAVRAQRHFGFFIGLHAAPPRLRRALLAISRTVQAGVGALLAVWGFRLAHDNWSVAMAGVPLPQGVAYLPMCIGGLLIAAFALELLASDAGLAEES